MGLLGIDLGTSSVKVVVIDELGHTLSSSKGEYSVISEQPGWAESNPNEWWEATVTAVRNALASLEGVKIEGIGLSGQMHGVVLANSAGKFIRPAILWADNRAESVLEQYRNLPQAILNQLANPLVPGMAGPILCWLAKYERDIYNAAWWAFQPKDWIRFCLTGVAAADPSDASATLLYDLVADEWLDDVITGLELNPQLLPPLLPSHAIAGTLTKQAAEALGLPTGIPVATGAADTAAAALGTGLFDTKVVQFTMGTGAQLLRLCNKPIPDSSGRTHLYRAATEASWYSMAAVQNGGLALDWVRRVLNASWDELYSSIETISPGSDGLSFLPYLTRERSHHPNPASTGAFLEMRIDHRREHFLHAALEGVAFGIRVALEALPDIESITTLRMAGGGSVEPKWRQMLANILGRELWIVDTPAASARGAAILGGIAVGIWANTAATLHFAPSTQLAAIPDPSQKQLYDEIFAKYL
jgi:xylulokinase